MKRVDVVIAMIVRNRRVLVCQRRKQDAFAGFWEFPGGKREGDETAEQCLRRELMEELGIAVFPAKLLTIIDHEYPALHVRLFPYLCAIAADADPKPLASQQLRWVDPAELRQLEFPAANARLVEELAEELTARLTERSWE
jgi:A/G-specific adenine glycosylase